jgi:hypothetical protein
MTNEKAADYTIKAAKNGHERAHSTQLGYAMREEAKLSKRITLRLWIGT